MNNLFLKIFLWFWGTLLLVVLALSAGVRSAEYLLPEENAIASKFLLFLPVEAKRAVDIYERGGKKELDGHFAFLISSGFVQPFLFDERRREVLGRVAPSKAAAFSRRATNDAPLIEFFSGHQIFAAQRVTGTSGRTYTALVVISGKSLFLSLLREKSPKLWWGVWAIVVIGTWLCVVLARHISRPVVQLGIAAGRLADGLLETRVDTKISSRSDEIGNLGLSFDRMAGRIEALLRSQQRMLGDVSHELRSPLARLNVAQGLLRQCPAEERTEYLDRIESEVENLDRLIGQLLTLARIESGADASGKDRVELSSLVQEIAADGNFEAQGSGRAVTVKSAERCITPGGREQLRRAIENVVRNAIRHTRPATNVEIGVEVQQSPEPCCIVLQVRDHGPGVLDIHLGKIFQPFYRVATDGDHTSNGAGLGLAITDRIVRMYGGSVRAANANGGGLLVQFQLPLADAR